MRKIFLIIQREYLSRVRKKSFIIMTFLTPVLMAGSFMIPSLISSHSDQSVNIEVIDEAGMEFKNSEKTTFEKNSVSFDTAKARFAHDDYYAILYVPKTVVNDANGVVLYTRKDVSLALTERISNMIEQQLYRSRLSMHGIEKSTLDSLKADVNIKTLKATSSGEENSSSVGATIAGLISAFVIYFFIFIYGIQVMRGIMEEKTNRIVEVIISSVKPFQLMMGKIIGIALVALTQFLLWIILGFGLTSFVSAAFTGDKKTKEQTHQVAQPAGSDQSAIDSEAKQKEVQNEFITEIMETLSHINFGLIIPVFMFYFIGGYLLYGALFAAVGSAVDHDTDTQQFMMPITLPLILSFIVATGVVTTNPDSNVAFWFSIIPFTSPIVMVVRMPFGVPVPELLLSMSLLVAGFILTTWVAGRIYRTGILMYGKKVNYKELAKWLFYKG